MARATPKKSAPTATGKGAKSQTADISNFFRKTPSDQAVPRKASNGDGNGAILEDVKPNLQGPTTNGRARSWKGKEKATGGDTSADPVVISSDEEDRSPTVIKRQRTARSPKHRELLPSSPGAGPSRSRSRSKSAQLPVRSCSPPPAVFGPSPPPELETIRPPFAGVPDFRTPDKWPQIINTAEDLTQDDEDGDGSREGMDLDFDNDSQHAGMFEEEEEDGVEQDHDSAAPTVVDVDGEEVEDIPPERPVETNGTSRGGSIDLTMEWDEGDDEGMGMEEPDDYDDPPSRPSSRNGKAAGAPKGKLEKCPMCSKSMKGKSSHVVEKHINSCLDTSASSAGKGKKQHPSRPITSIGHAFSPAPSSPSPEPETPAKGPNAFSVLMSGHKEKEQWKTAEDDLRRDGKRTYGRRPAPFYKVMTGMPVAVDAFRYGAIPKVTAYLLTHAHSDHYTNLSKAWCHGPIYCSETTANLIIHMLGVEPKWVHGLPDDIPFEMPNTGGVTVTPLTANHCPGSSLFLFEGRQTVNAGDSAIKSPYVGSKRVFRYLHCGDFRACPKMVLHPAVARARIDTCYLDTTYLNPKYCFPPQPQVIEACATLARRTVLGMSDKAPPLEDAKNDIKPEVYGKSEYHQERSKEMMQGWLQPVKKEEPGAEGDVKPSLDVNGNGSVNGTGDIKPDVKDEKLVEVKPKPKGRTLVVMGTYSIGKERIVKAVAKILGSTIYCDPRKTGILLCETDPELHAMLSTDPIASQVHLLPLGNIQLDRLQDYLVRLHPHFDRVLGFRPTGWSYSPPAGTDMLPDVNMVIKRDQSRTFTHAGLQPQRGSCKQYMMYGVPYSEHSSFFELTCFALSLPGPDLRMIATVNVGNERSRAKMKKWFEKWSAEKARRKEKNLPSIVDYRDETYW